MDMPPQSLNRTALSATLHCLTGCAIGEVLGLIISTHFGLSNFVTIVLAIILAFLFGYSLSITPVIRSGIPVARAMKLVLAADTLSILTMEIADNLVMLAIPGAMYAGLGDWLFWVSMAISLAVAFCAAYPVNRALIERGRGHAVVHEFHHGHHSHYEPHDHSSHSDHGHDHHEHHHPQ